MKPTLVRGKEDKEAISSKYIICKRMTIILHELGHTLHYFNNNRQILKGEEHGKELENMMTSAIRKGVLKECAKNLRSPSAKCIFKQECIVCIPNV